MSNKMILARILRDRNDDFLNLNLRTITVDIEFMCEDCGAEYVFEFNRESIIDLYQDLGDWLHDERVRRTKGERR